MFFFKIQSSLGQTNHLLFLDFVKIAFKLIFIFLILKRFGILPSFSSQPSFYEIFYHTLNAKKKATLSLILRHILLYSSGFFLPDSENADAWVLKCFPVIGTISEK